ncbi:mediator of RNA polymerase II transcription subunit 12-like isoform X2 [Juglans regia]|uniref:Mediator of RNA polymerase II transcription subunit 12-like isoform X2 n=1 Tax=Juglans regia TaxID=51240 RepID=A0A6P9DVW9_JUGRE|nr:mediator of RNA polymerase II transcription subunit 12-like isoform X2 [Juglans regia]
MQRYHAASCTNAVSNSALGGPLTRDTARADSSPLSANFALNSRQLSQQTPYKLKCDKEPLNSRIGPPDFHPQTTTCPEETLTRDYVQSGYRETIEGIEEAREISLTQVQAFSKPVIVKCKEAIRKRLRAINESRAQKRKAGQVYDVPLSGSQLTKPGIFPEQRACGEDSRKKWIEVRPGSASISSGAPDKTQLSRTELWTKDVIDYMQYLLDDFFSRNNSHSTYSRDQSPQVPYAGSLQHRSDPASAALDGEEPSLHFKWWYMTRLLQWHNAEGLLLPSLIIDWVLNQLQEKDLLEILQFLLPIIYGVLETVVLSQTYVHGLFGVAIRFIRDPSPGGSDLVDNSRKAYTISALVEMLRYLIEAVPDTFVALDCFPLQPYVVSYAVSDGNFISKVSGDAEKLKNGCTEVPSMHKSNAIDAQYQSLAFNNVVSSIQNCAETLAKASSPGYLGHNLAKAVQSLDKSLVHGDVREASKLLFEDHWDGAIAKSWVAEVSQCLRSSLKWIGTVNLSFICSIFFLCEWATCDYRDFRTVAPTNIKFSGRKDFCQVYIAVRILKLKIKDLQRSSRGKSGSTLGVSGIGGGSSQQNSARTSVGNVFEINDDFKSMGGSSVNSDIFDSPGSLHDIIVCWIDQHEVCNGEGCKRLQLLIVELIRAGIFLPQAYVRQLIVSGIMDMNGPQVDLDRRKRHYRILKQLPGLFMCDALEETGITEGPHLLDAMHIYSNERRLALRGLFFDQQKNSKTANISAQKLIQGKDGASPALVEQRKAALSSSNVLPAKNIKNEFDIEELKVAISVLLQFPNSSSSSMDTGLDESQESAKRAFGSLGNKMDLMEGTPGCEECQRAKRQKLHEERSSCFQVHSPLPSDDEDTWWARKGPKSLESFKVDAPLKSIKQVPKSRQKTVRKTQSLAQLTVAARIEGGEGASTSHSCDNRVSCPHHKSVMEDETPKSIGGIRTNPCGDIVAIGKTLKKLRFGEKRTIIVWLMTVVRKLVEETENTLVKACQFARPFTPVDDRSSIGWKLGEDELSAILYFMDLTNDLVSAAKFLLWLFPKVLSSPKSTIHSGRNALMPPRNVDNKVCEVEEAFLLSSLRRYENILVATDLIPQTLSATMHSAAAVMASYGRVSGSAALVYAQYLLKKYGNVGSVIEWEKNFKVACDKKLLSELEAGRSADGELGFTLGVPAGVEDLDEFFRQKIGGGGRLSRVSTNMRDIVQRHIEDTFHYFLGKDRKLFTASPPKSPDIDKWDNGYQVAQQIVTGIMDCLRQTGGAAQEGDPSLVSSAVSAIIGNVGPTIAKIPDLSGINNTKSSSATGSLNFARHILRIHITSLCLLKEALGERQSRAFEIALATEASSVLAVVLSPGKASRTQFQLSPEAHDSNTNMSNEFLNSSTKLRGRATKIAAAVSGLVIGLVIHGVTSLERMVTVLRLKEGLDVIQFVRNTRSSANGNARSIGAPKVDNSVEVKVHWFRLLVGNCKTICDGLIVELLGEPCMVALSRMQRMLPLSLVFAPAYSIFAFLMWRPFILNTNLANREDINQLYQSLTVAIVDAIKHLPFRDVCLRDSCGFYDLVAADAIDAEFAAMLDLNGSDIHLKSMAFVPLRARLFLNTIIDCKMPQSLFVPEDGNRSSGHGESEVQYSDKETKLLDKLVHALDTLQPAKLHWQWVELRLLLNEQSLLEKLDSHNMSLVDALRSSSPSGKAAASENENYFITIILTRLLVRPDAASLFSEVVHLFGQSLEDSMLLQAKWFLGGPDVLFGRKTIRQRLISIAENEGFSSKAQFWKPWGWCNSGSDSKRGGKKFEVTSLEEGEVVEEGTDSKKYGSTQTLDMEGSNVHQQQVTEKALIELLIPCIDRSTDESRNTFASDLIKQFNTIDQQINAVICGASKQAGTIPSGIEGPVNKRNNRKVMRGGSPGLARRPTGTSDSAPPSPAALRASMSLRLQLLLRFLPIICADGEPSGRNMRQILAPIILRLLGNRVVYEDADLSFYQTQSYASKMEVESPAEASSVALAGFSGDSLFDRLLLVLHGLLSSCQPSWLRSKPDSKSSSEFTKESSGFDCEVAEALQNDLYRMQLPDTIRLRIQTAMPILLPSVRCSVSCQPPSVPFAGTALLQSSISLPGAHSCPPQRNMGLLARTATNISGKFKPSLLQLDHDMEIDPWTLLEDGAVCGPSSSNTAVIGSGDHGNLRASSWLKGAVRVRRTDLTYTGAMDDDS